MPNSFSETQDGQLLIADGFGPMLRWDGLSAGVQPAGVPAPTDTPIITPSSSPGGIVGKYRAYVRFLDSRGNVSDLSPVSTELDVASSTGSVTGTTAISPITLTSANHGLSNASRVKVEGVTGQTGANGIWDIQVVDADHFILMGSVHSGNYKGGGTWTAGAESLTYFNVATSDDPRVVRRQVLRNTDGQFTTFYVDVDSADLIAPTFTTTRNDTDLAAQTAVPILDPDGVDIANIHAEPPQTKAYLANHLGRMFAAGEVEYSEGAVRLTFGSRTVRGIGTEWTEAASFFWLYAVGADKPYEIESVDTTAQTLTLNDVYFGQSKPYASYALRPPPAEERLVPFSEAGRTESWPAVNALQLPDDGDQITGLMSHRSLLYILERRHIYRLTFGEDPPRDGDIYLAASRGCINHRCFALVEGACYALDEHGIHVFQKAGTENTSVSTTIQTLFRSDGPGPRINWSSSRYFHCVADPATETIRWFVSLSGQYLPRHALVYHYTLNRWWLEEYAVPVGASVLGKLSRIASLSTWGVGREQVYLGSQHRRVLAWGAGPLDGYNPAAGSHKGTVVSAGRRSLTADFQFWDEAVGCPVVITAGRGKGQTRLVTAVDGTTLQVRRPWLTLPDATSEFQLGGFGWGYRTGWFRWADDESQNVRRVEIIFEPTRGQTIDLRRYRDRLDTPEVMASSRSDDGVRATKGEAELEIDLDRPTGFVQTRLDGGKELYTHGMRQVSIGLSGVAGQRPVRVYQLRIDGATAGRGVDNG